MKKTLLLTIFIQLLFLKCFGDYCDTLVSRKTNCPIPSNFNNVNSLVLVFENDTFKIFTNFDELKENITGFVQKHQVEDDSILLNLISDSSQTIEKKVQRIRSSRAMNNRLEYRIIDLLKSKNCLIFNKSTNAYEDCLLEVTYSKNCDVYIKYQNCLSSEIIKVYTGSF